MKNALQSLASLAFFTASIGVAESDVLITIDLSVNNIVTFTATNGTSAATLSGDDGIGIYFEDFYGTSSAVGLVNVATVGDFSSAENTADGVVDNLYRGSGDPGLNYYNWATGPTASFTEDSLAFVGSVSASLTTAQYNDMLSGNTSGNIYFPADSASSASGATILGTYVVVTEPSGNVDGDGDGVPQIVEAFFGTSDANANEFPVLTPTIIGNKLTLDNLYMDYDPAGLDGMDGTADDFPVFEISTDLETWTPVADGAVTFNSPPSVSIIEVDIGQPAEPKIFIRANFVAP